MTSTPVYDFPAVNANYVYDQLYYLSMVFKQRESGFDNDPEHNGHKAFAQYWAQEMMNNLQGFGAKVAYDLFNGGWISRSADSPSYNVEVTIPGAVHPEQVVVVGTHYDGMHISQGSAFDDTSGCAVILGIAKALGDYWRAHHLYPARTLRFVIFDAEEEGILGSYHYVNSTVNGDTGNIVAMINEEQSGFSYPARFLGKASNPFIPLRIWNSTNNNPKQLFADLTQSALPQVASEMRTMGYTTLSYHGDNGQDLSQPIFTDEQVRQSVVTGDLLGGSDDAAFDQAHVPALTFISGDEGGDSPNGQTPPPNIPQNELYPFDTQYDTIQYMNGYVSGSTRKSSALTLALGFQTMLQAWMFNQSTMVGSIPATNIAAGPIATISDIGIIQTNMAFKLDVHSSYDPRSAQSQLSYHWDFGDGAQADGISIQHIYTHAGNFMLTLTVKDAQGTRTVSKSVSVANTAPSYPNGFIQILEQERDSGSELAKGDHHPGTNHQFPPMIQNGDGLTDEDHFPGHP